MDIFEKLINENWVPLKYVHTHEGKARYFSLSKAHEDGSETCILTWAPLDNTPQTIFTALFLERQKDYPFVQLDMTAKGNAFLSYKGKWPDDMNITSGGIRKFDLNKEDEQVKFVEALKKAAVRMLHVGSPGSDYEVYYSSIIDKTREAQLKLGCELDGSFIQIKGEASAQFLAQTTVSVVELLPKEGQSLVKASFSPVIGAKPFFNFS